MSIHSYTLKSLLFLTLLLQTACNIGEHKNSFELEEVKEFKSAFFDAFEALTVENQNAEVTDKEPETWMREAGEEQERAQRLHAAIQAQMSVSVEEEIKEVFPKMVDFFEKFEESAREKNRQINDLPDGLEKYAKRAKLHKTRADLFAEALIFIETIKARLEEKNT